MPTFTYTARDAKGELKTATIDAPNRDDVVEQLRRQRMNVVKIEGSAKAKQKSRRLDQMRDIVIFTRQFSTMINSGLPLVQALDILAQQSENKRCRTSTRQVVFDVESGHTVADALGKHPKAFTRPVREHGRGRRGGRYSRHDPDAPRDVHGKERRARPQGEGRHDLPRRHHERGASIAITVLLIFVIPVFQRCSRRCNMALPLPTRIVIGHLGLPEELLVGDRRAARRRRVLGFKQLLRHVRTASSSIDRLMLACAGARRRAAQVGGVALHAHARHADLARACRSSTASRSRPRRPATA